MLMCEIGSVFMEFIFKGLDFEDVWVYIFKFEYVVDVYDVYVFIVVIGLFMLSVYVIVCDECF